MENGASYQTTTLRKLCKSLFTPVLYGNTLYYKSLFHSICSHNEDYYILYKCFRKMSRTNYFIKNCKLIFI